VLTGASVIGRLALGVFSDRYSAWLLALLTLSSASGIVFVFWGILAHNLGGICAFGLLYGAIAGGWSSLSAGLVR
jgi:MFS transporter, MCT family, solute carrier family 16 (monocarboxylic acid transporters), member 10